MAQLRRYSGGCRTRTKRDDDVTVTRRALRQGQVENRRGIRVVGAVICVILHDANDAAGTLVDDHAATDGAGLGPVATRHSFIHNRDVPRFGIVVDVEIAALLETNAGGAKKI